MSKSWMVRKLKADHLSEFCRQIGAMTGAGITVAKAMEILKTATENRRIARLYGELENRIREGQAIGDSLDEIGVFPELMVNMFRAAEVSGQLEKTANDLAEHYRKEHRMENQIKTATLYPKLLCIMAAGIVLFIFLIIMPMVEPLFAGTELPMITRSLMSISRGMKEYWYAVFLAVLFLLVLGPVLLSFETIHNFWDRVRLQVPIVGKQLRIIYTARFARSQSGLYASGVSMVESLRIASKTIGNRYLEGQFDAVIMAVQNGMSLSQAIEMVDGLDRKLPAIIRVGEETGKLDTMLEKFAEGYEHESEVALNRMVSLLEPLMLVIIGTIVAVILLGIMVPMWSMYENIL